MEKPVIQRFIEAVNHLLKSKKASSKKEIATSMGVSPSYFSEILKDRINLSADLLQKFLIKWPVNPAFIFAVSDDILTYTPQAEEPFTIVSDVEQGYNPTPKKENVTPTEPKSVTPTVTPTHDLGMPKVVTVDKLGRDNVVLVPVKARAGYLLGYGDPQYISELPSYHLPGISGGTFRAFEVEGHSMVPTIQKGDLVVGEYIASFDFITDDRVYVIITKDDGILVKRVLNRISKYGFIIAKSDAIQNRSMYPNINISPADILEMWYVRMKLSTDISSPSDLWDRVNDLEAVVESLRMDIQKLTP